MKLEHGVRLHYPGDTRRLFAYRQGVRTAGSGSATETSDSARSPWDIIRPLLIPGPGRDQFMDPRGRGILKNKLGLRDRPQTTALVQALISGLGRSDGQGPGDLNGPRERLIARDLLQNFVDMRKVDPEVLQRSYSEAVQSKGVAKDPARARSLFKVGEIIASRIPATAEVWKDIKEGWDKVAGEMKVKPDWLDPGQITKQIPLQQTERTKVLAELPEDAKRDQRQINSMLYPPTPRGANREEEREPASSDKFPGQNRETRDRREQVLKMSRDGLSQGEIANKLSIGTKTVDADRRTLNGAGFFTQPGSTDEQTGAKKEPEKGNDTAAGKQSAESQREPTGPSPDDFPGDSGEQQRLYGVWNMALNGLAPGAIATKTGNSPLDVARDLVSLSDKGYFSRSKVDELKGNKAASDNGEVKSQGNQAAQVQKQPESAPDAAPGDPKPVGDQPTPHGPTDGNGRLDDGQVMQPPGQKDIRGSGQREDAEKTSQAKTAMDKGGIDQGESAPSGASGSNSRTQEQSKGKETAEKTGKDTSEQTRTQGPARQEAAPARQPEPEQAATKQAATSAREQAPREQVHREPPAPPKAPASNRTREAAGTTSAARSADDREPARTEPEPTTEPQISK